MDRWNSLGLRIPLACVDKRNTYLQYLPYDIYNLIPYYLYKPDTQVVRGTKGSFEIHGGGIFSITTIRSCPIREVVQRVLNDSSAEGWYPLSNSWYFKFQGTRVEFCYETAIGTVVVYRVFELCFELVQALANTE